MSCLVHTLEPMAEVEGATVVGVGQLVVQHGEIRVLVVRDGEGLLRAVHWDRSARAMVAPIVDGLATDRAGSQLVWRRPPVPPV